MPWQRWRSAKDTRYNIYILKNFYYGKSSSKLLLRPFFFDFSRTYLFLILSKTDTETCRESGVHFLERTAKILGDEVDRPVTAIKFIMYIDSNCSSKRIRKLLINFF